MDLNFSVRQKVRFQQIIQAAKHKRKIPNIQRWKLFFEFQESIYQEYLRSQRRKYPEISDEEIIEIKKQEVLNE